MPTFQVKARAWDGRVTSIEVEASSKEDVISRLRQKKLMVTSIAEKRSEPAFQIFSRGVTSKEVAIFANMFSVMIGSGVPLVRCLSILQAQMQNPEFCRIIGQVRNEVEGGSTFSVALSKHPKVFDHLVCNLVRAGEAGGILDKILERLAGYLEKSEELRAKVKGALTYPVVVLGVACCVILGLVVFVLPTFKGMFEQMKVELPAVTQMLLGFSDILRDYWWLIVPTFGLVVTGITKFFKSPQGQRAFDNGILRVPVFGEMMRKVAVARFTRTLGTMITSGVPILQALEVTAATAGNIVIKEAVDRTRASIREGESIADPLRQSGVFPPMVVQMISVGEETGGIDHMLLKIADFYDTEVDTTVKALTSVIEPIMIVVMGVMIAGIVLAVFVPMLEMTKNMG